MITLLRWMFIGLVLFACAAAAAAVFFAAVDLALGDTTRSPPLSLVRARLLVSSMGINVGKIFADDDDRYALTRIEARTKGPNTFIIEVDITPLPKHVN